MSGLPHAINEYLRESRRQQRPAVEPSTIVTGVSKEYVRFPHISLPTPSSPLSLLEAARRRSSCRDTTNNPPTIEQLGELFGIAMKQHEGGIHRPYPSGGALYPIEAYIIGKIGDQGNHVYHYQSGSHSLEKLWPVKDEDMSEVIKGSANQICPAVIVLTSRWFRSEQKYRDFSYNLSLLEAGHVAQNILLSSVAANLCTCPIGGFDEKIISRLLDLFPNEEDPVYVITISN